jgi:hypothetical protein
MTIVIVVVVSAVLGYLLGRRVARLRREQIAEVNRLQRLRDLIDPR